MQPQSVVVGGVGSLQDEVGNAGGVVAGKCLAGAGADVAAAAIESANVSCWCLKNWCLNRAARCRWATKVSAATRWFPAASPRVARTGLRHQVAHVKKRTGRRIGRAAGQKYPVNSSATPVKMVVIGWSLVTGLNYSNMRASHRPDGDRFCMANFSRAGLRLPGGIVAGSPFCGQQSWQCPRQLIGVSLQRLVWAG